jgi:pheromone a factor receptor
VTQKQESANQYDREIFQKNPAMHSVQGYTRAVDMWAIGCIAIVLLTGDSLFIGNEDSKLPKYEHGFTTQLAALCDLHALNDSENDRWKGIGTKSKDFIRKLLVLDENKRMTATEALCHPLFSDDCYAAEYKAIYEKAIYAWERTIRGKAVVEQLVPNM